jgi:hypothetical protein
MRHINPGKAAIAVGSVVGLWHLIWVTLVGIFALVWNWLSAESAPVRKNQRARDGRSGGTRTHDPRFWRPMLYQLSYTPKRQPRGS